jgi:hypothetical protein
VAVRLKAGAAKHSANPNRTAFRVKLTVFLPVTNGSRALPKRATLGKLTIDAASISVNRDSRSCIRRYQRFLTPRVG